MDRERGSEGEREGGREGGREGEREGGREGDVVVDITHTFHFVDTLYYLHIIIDRISWPMQGCGGEGH